MFGKILLVNFVLNIRNIGWLCFNLVLDAIENVDYFNNIEKVLSSVGLSISDAVMTFFNSGGVQNKDVCILTDRTKVDGNYMCI